MFLIQPRLGINTILALCNNLILAVFIDCYQYFNLDTNWIECAGYKRHHYRQLFNRSLII